MAIAFAAVSAMAAGATSAAPTYPAVSANNQLFLGATCKPDTSTFPTISGWDKIVDRSVGAGAGGAGDGPQRLGVYKRTATGSESGTVTVTPTGTPNVVQAFITNYSCAANKVFDLLVETGSDITLEPNIILFAESVIGETAGDTMVWISCTAANSNQGSSTFTATGATYGTTTERLDAGTTTGNDSRHSTGDRPITSGTATDATRWSTTIAVEVTGGCAFLRLREVDPPSGGGLPPRPVIVNQAINRASTY